jgi:hypothetical protein
MLTVDALASDEFMMSRGRFRPLDSECKVGDYIRYFGLMLLLDF